MDILVDEAVTNAFSGVAQNLMIQLNVALVDLASFNYVIHDFFVKNLEFPHLLVDLGQELNILGSILNHDLGKRSSLPEFIVILHS